jgi:hypothetical protein
VIVLHQVREELEEEGHEQQADVHAIHVGIGGDHDPVVPQTIHAVLDVQRRLDQVELLVLIHHLLRQAVAVQRFALQAEHTLQVHIAAFGDAAAGTVTLGDEECGGLLPVVLLRIVQVDAAIAQFAVVQTRLLRTIPRQLPDPAEFLPLAFVVEDPLLEDIRDLRILVQEVVQFATDEVADEGAHALPTGLDLQRTEFGLGLAFEHGFDHLYADCRDNARAHITGLPILLVEILDGLGHRFAEGTLVRTTLCGVLSVHEAVVLLSVVVRVGDRNLDVIADQVDDRIERLAVHLHFQADPRSPFLLWYFCPL